MFSSSSGGGCVPIHVKSDPVKRAFISIAIAMMLMYGYRPVFAQPVDLCNQANGVTLSIGGLEQVEIFVSAGKKIKVTIISDCENTPTNPPAHNGVYPSGGTPGTDYDSTPITWDTYSAGEHDGEWYVGIDVYQDAVFNLTLDACAGTVVRIECM